MTLLPVARWDAARGAGEGCRLRRHRLGTPRKALPGLPFGPSGEGSGWQEGHLLVAVPDEHWLRLPAKGELLGAIRVELSSDEQLPVLGQYQRRPHHLGAG